MLDDLHALVEFAQAGSIAGAADRLSRTPSAGRLFLAGGNRGPVSSTLPWNAEVTC